jgi:hypothetical protein
VSEAQYNVLLRMLIAAKVMPGESTVARIPPTPTESAALKQLREGDVAAGVKAMLDIHAQSPIPEAREGRLNMIGYQYSAQDKHQEAMAILGMGTALYPLSANAWDSLGDVKRTAGARASFQRSLEQAEKSNALLPETRAMLVDNARKALKEL